ncbi:hypothetical protein CH274_15490 [Rhodococcus sp. 06-418-5]|uniref:hypothetical protein n=1 Tax=Rhodococcus sp. 06-418-5 TaxID=2022507 RepID=UPI000B9C497C|nr:hypothetical protein [Rhodococcus sp. 06-418-5]OZC80572.1 hypothetical protein CH274_15490 [Rhodococcus sp. 06-418-5]
MSSIACFHCGRPTGDGLPICTKCTEILVRMLQSVPGLVADMTITQARLDRMSRGRVGGKSADTPLPISIDKSGNVPIRRPFDLLENEITTWSRDFESRISPAGSLLAAIERPGLLQMTLNCKTGRRHDQSTLSTQPTRLFEEFAVWLACHPHDLRMHPAIDEMFDSLSDVIAIVNKAIDQLPELRYKGVCQYVEYDQGRERRCNADLYAEKGEEWVQCPRCRASYAVAKLDRDILAQMREMNYTAVELQSLLRELGKRVPKSTLYRWINERKLTPRGWMRDGRIIQRWIHRNDPAVYRLGDVLDLATRTERVRS